MIAPATSTRSCFGPTTSSTTSDPRVCAGVDTGAHSPDARGLSDPELRPDTPTDHTAQPDRALTASGFGFRGRLTGVSPGGQHVRVGAEKLAVLTPTRTRGLPGDGGHVPHHGGGTMSTTDPS